MFKVTLSGTFDANSFRQMMDELAVEKGEYYFWPVMLSGPDLDLSQLDPGAVMRASEAFLEHNAEMVSSKVAIVTSPNSDLTTAKEFTNVTGPRTRAYLNFFRSEEEALAWLLHENVEGRSFA